MKVWKLVSGILSIILFVVISLQSCAVGIGNTLEDNGEIGGSAGILVAIFMLAGGIVSIATRKGGKGGNIALIVLFGLAALVGFLLAGSYADLKIWSAWCLINAVIAFIALKTKKKKKRTKKSVKRIEE
nr:MAG TPA: Heme exporter protein D (CcmD) [Caudoviricetes sp.]